MQQRGIRQLIKKACFNFNGAMRNDFDTGIKSTQILGEVGEQRSWPKLDGCMHSLLVRWDAAQSRCGQHV